MPADPSTPRVRKPVVTVRRRVQVTSGMMAIATCLVASLLFSRPLMWNASIAGQSWYGAAPRDMFEPALTNLILWAVGILLGSWLAYVASRAALLGLSNARRTPFNEAVEASPRSIQHGPASQYQSLLSHRSRAQDRWGTRWRPGGVALGAAPSAGGGAGF